MYRRHRYNLIRFDLSTADTAYKLFVKSINDYVIVKEVTVSDVTVRTYFIAYKNLETNWSNRASLTYSVDIQDKKLVNEGQNWLAAAIGQITELLTGVNYRVEDYPLVWIEDTYYTTYKDNIFQVSVKTDVPTQAEYDAVTTIDLSNQSLTTDVTFLDKFRNLINLLISDNNIDIIDLSKIYNKLLIKNIAIKNNNITTCDLQGFNNAESILIHTNNISVVDFSDLLSVERLEFYANNISVVDLSNSSNLDILIGFQNSLTNIDLSNNTLLTELILFSNSITSIDLSNNTLLTNCRLQSNDLTNIDLSNNTLLTDVRIHNNELDAATNSQVLIDLDSHGLSNGYLQSTIFGGGTLTAAGQIAKANLQAKGWSIVGI